MKASLRATTRFAVRRRASAQERIRRAVDAERTRLRHELHDGLGPLLSGIGLCAQTLSDSLGEGGSEKERALLDRIRAEASHAVTEVRRLIEGLPPAAVDSYGLVEALRRHARFAPPTTAVEIVASSLPLLPAPLETAAYRIVTEALTNVVRHAGARHTRVTLTGRRRALVISIADDGRGIARFAPGVGLTSLRHRAEAAGGRFSIHSVPGNGTEVRVRLPLARARAA